MANLGPRLEAALAFLGSVALLADVGTDHGRFAIEAVRRGKAARALAIDDKSGPLEQARANVKEADLHDRIDCILADGLPRGSGADAVAILGLGGIAIASILDRAELTGVRRLVLGPHSEAAVLRGWLEAHGFAIDAEDFVAERRKHYQIVSAIPGTMRLTASEREFGPFIIRTKNPAFCAFIAARIAVFEAALASVADEQVRKEIERRIAVHRELIR
jgi:tRNA (adenine22-N1)-methyltransferase